MRDLEKARILLNMAGKDLQVVAILTAVERAPEEVIGFHAQQAVEKALKAWLAILGQEFPRTHSLRMLILLLENRGINVDDLWGFTELSPFAVQFRYESFDGMVEEIDCLDVLDSVRTLVERVGTEWEKWSAGTGKCHAP